MAYVVPNTSVYVLRGVPLDMGYEHTIYFANKASQQTYFSSKVKYSFLSCTYQRPFLNRIKIERSADDLYDCNYLMFQNTAYGSKWFYAFINEINYISDVASEIVYTLDVMQTYFFDYTLDQCFVEREHSETDNFGENLIPENLELGEYITDDFDGSGVLSQKSIVVAATFDDQYNNAVGDIASGLYSALQYHVFPHSIQGMIDCNNFIINAGAKASGIVAVYICPTRLINRYNHEPQSTGNAVALNINKSKKISGAIDGSYIPNNNKLYTYPYNFLYATNLQGGSAIFRYEYFTNIGPCEFLITGDMNPSMNAYLAPKNYKGTQVNYDEKLTLTGWPIVPYVTDSYKAYLAQTASSTIMGSLSGAMEGGLTGGVAGLLAKGGGAAISGLSNIAGQTYTQMILSKIEPSYAMPNQAHGYPAQSSACATGLLDFAFMHKHIREEYVKIIDEYFTRYGYACHRIKIPNTHARPEFTYTKTKGCTITPAANTGLPADAERDICAVYDHGVTFWINPAHIGQYNGSANRPV